MILVEVVTVSQKKLSSESGTNTYGKFFIVFSFYESKKIRSSLSSIEFFFFFNVLKTLLIFHQLLTYFYHLCF